MTDFDPYNALIELNERLLRLEKAHNHLAHAYEKSERELNMALDALQSLQISHLVLSNIVSQENQDNTDSTDNTDNIGNLVNTFSK